MLDHERLRRTNCILEENVVQNPSPARMLRIIGAIPSIYLIGLSWPNFVEGSLRHVGLGIAYRVIVGWRIDQDTIEVIAKR